MENKVSSRYPTGVQSMSFPRRCYTAIIFGVSHNKWDTFGSFWRLSVSLSLLHATSLIRYLLERETVAPFGRSDWQIAAVLKDTCRTWRRVRNKIKCCSRFDLIYVGDKGRLVLVERRFVSTTLHDVTTQLCQASWVLILLKLDPWCHQRPSSTFWDVKQHLLDWV